MGSLYGYILGALLLAPVDTDATMQKAWNGGGWPKPFTPVLKYHPPLRRIVLGFLAKNEMIADDEKDSFLVNMRVQWGEGIGLWDSILSEQIELLRRDIEYNRQLPPITDAKRFPDEVIIQQCLKINREYENWLRKRLDFYPDRESRFDEEREELQQAIADTVKLQLAYLTLATIANEDYGTSARRQALLDYYNLVGFQMYYDGGVPPYLPIEYFWELDP